MHMNLIFLTLEFPFLWFCGTLVAGFLIIFSCQILANRNQVSHVPPGSQGLPLIGETVQFLVASNSSKGFYHFVETRSLRYGNCFKTNIFGETHVFFSSIEAAKVILKNDSGIFTKRYLKTIARLVGDKSLLCLPQDHHRLIRGRLSNLFTTTTLSSFIKQFDEQITTTLSGWERGRGGDVVVLNEALKVTFKAMCKILVSFESGEEAETMEKDVGDICKAMLGLPLKLPGTRFYKGLQARKRIMRTLEKLISLRRRGLEAGEDFLQYLVAEADIGGSVDESLRLTDTEIKENILTMIIAGYDTTASAITWMVKYLSDNPEVLDAVKVEQLKLAERTSTKSHLTLQDLNDMPYASKVVKESLRMASVVAWFPRLVLQDCEIEGYKIKKGWSVNVVARSLHLDPTVYNDPNKFNPSRFDEESKPYSFLAFGIGGRTCLGLNMAKAMMLVFLHRLVTTYKWKVIDQDSRIDERTLFLRLKSGCPIHVTRILDNLKST